MMMPTRLWTCYWARRRLQRYLDADPAAPLSAAEIARVEAHLAICARCVELAQDYRGLRRELATWSQRWAPNRDLVDRMHATVRQLVAEDTGSGETWQA